MKIDELHEILVKSFNSSISFREIKPQTFQLFLPYYHLDGDMIDIFIQFIGKKIILTDFGQTMMRLSYYTDLNSAGRKKIFDSIFSNYTVQYNGKWIYVEFDSVDELYPYIMEMIAVITKVSDISFLKQERAKNFFYEEFDDFMMNDVKNKLNVGVDKDFSPSLDSKKDYAVPYVLNYKKPVFIFPILTDEKCLEASMILLFYAKNNFDNFSVSIFRDHSDINSKYSGRLIDMSDRPLTTFDNENKSKMINFALSCAN